MRASPIGGTAGGRRTRRPILNPANASHAPFPLVALSTNMASKLKRLGKLVYNVTSIITTVRLLRRLARKFRSSG